MSMPHTWSSLLSAEQNPRSQMLPNLQGRGWHLPYDNIWGNNQLGRSPEAWVARIPVGYAGTSWHDPGPVTEATGLAVTSMLLKLLSPHFRASHFNLPKWQTAIISKMTFTPVWQQLILSKNSSLIVCIILNYCTLFNIRWKPFSPSSKTYKDKTGS